MRVVLSYGSKVLNLRPTAADLGTVAHETGPLEVDNHRQSVNSPKTGRSVGSDEFPKRLTKILTAFQKPLTILEVWPYLGCTNWTVCARNEGLLSAPIPVAKIEVSH